MFRALLVFIVLLALLGMGTIWFVEKGTGEDLIPHQHLHLDNAQVQSFYLTQKLRLHYWWSRLTGSTATSYSSVRDERPKPTNQPEIIKWKDAQGTWHFEDKPSENSPPPDHH